MIRTRQITIANKARNSPCRAYTCRRLSHFDAAETRFGALEVAANDYGTTMLGAAEDASLGYLDNAIDEIIGNIIVTLPLWKGEEEYYDGQAKDQEELLDDALASYHAASAGETFYMKKVKTILPNGTVQITYVQVPVTYAGTKSALLSTATAVSAVNTSVNNGKSARTAAVNNAISAAKTANATVRKTKDAEVGKLYTKVENTAWNTYYVAAYTAEATYLTSYKQTENIFNNSKNTADCVYLTTMVPATIVYEKTLREYDVLFQTAIASAFDLNFNVNSWFNNNGNNQINYQFVTMATLGAINPLQTLGDILLPLTKTLATEVLPIIILTQTRATGAGHHFVPKQVIDDAFKAGKISDDVKNYFLTNTIMPDFYNHGNDTWLGVTHPQYNKASGELLHEYLKHNGNKINMDQAKDFLHWMETSKINNRDVKSFQSFLKFTQIENVMANHQTTSTWRRGFMAGNSLLEGLAAQGHKLSPQESKAFLKIAINGESAEGASGAVAKMLKTTQKIGVKQLIKKGASKVLPLIAPVFIAVEAAKGEDAWDGFIRGAREATAADLAEGLLGPVLGVIEVRFDSFIQDSIKTQQLLRLYEDPMNYKP